MDHDAQVPVVVRARGSSADNVKLFAKHGPRWMILCMLVERFPYKTALTIASSYAVWKFRGH